MSMGFPGRVLRSRHRRRQQRRARTSSVQEVQQLEDRRLLSGTTLSGTAVEQAGATQAPDLLAFAQALTDAGAIFYGASFCPFCTQQKELFEDGGDFLPYVEVTNPDRTLNQAGLDAFDENGNGVIDGEEMAVFPTWEFADGSRLTGLQSLETLSTQSGVAIPDGAVPCFADLPDVGVLGGSPLLVGINGYDPNNDTLTYTVSSDNPLVSAELFSGNRSMHIDVAGYGSMVFELFETRAPRATGRFIELAEDDFFDNVIFHRVINNFVIQGGDPTGTGSGGSTLGDFDDQFDVDLQHNSTGLLSMAKSSDDTNDSQFFVTEGASRHLDFNHTIFGKLVEGEANREAISNTAVTNSVPDIPIRMETVDIFQDVENAVLMLKADEGASGSANITVTVSDTEGNTYTQTFAVTVTPDTVNGGPFLTDVSDIHVVAGDDFTIELNAMDVEGDALTFGIDTNLSDATGLSAITGNSITLSTSPDLTADIPIAVAVTQTGGSDTQDQIDQQIITIRIAPATPVVSVTATDDTADEAGLDGGEVQFSANRPIHFRDDFNGTSLDTDLWDLAEPSVTSTEGRTEFRANEAPEVSGGLLRLTLDTFNPFAPGGSFLGDAITTDDAFTRSDGLVFETRARIIDDAFNPLDRGLAASFFTRAFDTGARDEISLDVLSNDILDSEERIRTATSNDEALGQSANAAFSTASGLIATGFNTYRIEWFPDRVDWFVNDVLVRSETGTIPDDPMNFGLSLFAPDSTFTDAFDATLQPAATSAANETYFFEVDFVEIRRPVRDLTVSYSSTGAATDGADFTTGGTSVLLSSSTGAASASATVPVTLLQDTIAERSEDATLTIDADASYEVGVPASATVTIADDDPLPTMAEVEVRLRIDATATDSLSETDTLPDNEEWVDEWEEFFVEIWARVPDSEGFGVLTASADLTYNTDYFTATGVEFGAPFTTGQSFTIDDDMGLVDDITATATSNDAGGNRFVLLARVAFASVDTDGVAINSQTDYVTPMTDLDVMISNISVDVADTPPVTVSTGTLPQTEVWPMLLDLNDDHTVGFGDVTPFGQLFNESTSNTDAFKADFDRSMTVGFGDVSLLASNFNRTRSSTGRQTYDAGFPEEWRPDPLHASIAGSGETGDDAQVDESELSELAAALIEILRGAGLSDADASQLEGVAIEVRDLPGRQLGYARDGRVVIDVDGAGLGWFVDATPADDIEFSTSGPATERYDLLTALAHEFGHVLGLDHGAEGSLMDETLVPGERRLTDLDDLFAEPLEVL